MKSPSRITLQRNPSRGSDDQDTIFSILDATFLCHVGFVIDGEARVLPTAFVRRDNSVFLHGHLHNQMLNALLNQQMACITVTHLDGLVLARSGFHHSVNYRSVVLFGRGKKVETDNKREILDAIVDHMVPDRSQSIRPATESELNATLVVEVPISEASAKIRTGPPLDLESDYALDCWAGVVHLKTRVENIENCPRLPSEIGPPNHVKALDTDSPLIG